MTALDPKNRADADLTSVQRELRDNPQYVVSRDNPRLLARLWDFGNAPKDAMLFVQAVGSISLSERGVAWWSKRSDWEVAALTTGQLQIVAQKKAEQVSGSLAEAAWGMVRSGRTQTKVPNMCAIPRPDSTAVPVSYDALVEKLARALFFDEVLDEANRVGECKPGFSHPSVGDEENRERRKEIIHIMWTKTKRETRKKCEAKACQIVHRMRTM